MTSLLWSSVTSVSCWMWRHIWIDIVLSVMVYLMDVTESTVFSSPHTILKDGRNCGVQWPNTKTKTQRQSLMTKTGKWKAEHQVERFRPGCVAVLTGVRHLRCIYVSKDILCGHISTLKCKSLPPDAFNAFNAVVYPGEGRVVHSTTLVTHNKRNIRCWIMFTCTLCSGTQTLGQTRRIVPNCKQSTPSLFMQNEAGEHRDCLHYSYCI